MKRIDRITAILIQLQTQNIITAREIAQRFNISIRTVYRDIRTLETAGIPIGSEPGKGYFLVEGYHLPPVMFTIAEVNALLTAGKFLNNVSDKSFLGDFQSAMGKIKSLLKFNENEYLNELQAGLKVYPSIEPESLLEEQILSSLQSAICNKKIICIQYQSLRESMPEYRKVEPVSLGYYENNWYLIAFCHLRNEYRNFRVDRINHLRIENQSFNSGNHPPVEKIIKEMYSYKTHSKVVLHIKKGKIFERIKKKYSIGILDENDLGKTSQLILSTDSLEILGKQLIEYLPDVEIIDPPELKQIIQNYISKIN